MARYGTIGWNIFDDWGKVITILCMELIEDVCWLGESKLRGGQLYCLIVLFFKGTMFKLQPCHYYEGFSQMFYIL